MSKAHAYHIEMEGYNDGHPYKIAQFALLGKATKSLEEHRLSNPKVRYRLISVLEDFS